jgi:hypothetical protein
MIFKDDFIDVIRSQKVSMLNSTVKVMMAHPQLPTPCPRSNAARGRVVWQ